MKIIHDYSQGNFPLDFKPPSNWDRSPERKKEEENKYEFLVKELERKREEK